MTDKRIEWRPWGPAAFEEARRHDKPILLRLSAVWCHWCHVMDQTSDKDPAAISLLNDRYVPVRVDIDERPDIRERYNFGGYPTSAFLTPGGEILTGGTYIPPDQFVKLLGHVADTYRSQKEDILAQIEKFHREHRHAEGPRREFAEAEAAARAGLDAVDRSLLLNFDPAHAGFGGAPKFPQAAAVELALRLHQDTGDADYEVVARRTLEALQKSALWDREEQGFFRYSVKGDWSQPHFEKMLETNAGLLANYGLAAGILRRTDFGETARELRDYLHQTLRDPGTGLFYGSQDADEEYYGLPLAERRRRKAPFVDTTSYTDWNAMMIRAYFDGFLGTGDASWLNEGLRSLDAVLRFHAAPNEGILHFRRDGKAQGAGLFSDQAHLVRTLVYAHELTGKPDYLQAADRLIAFAQKTMWDDQRQRFLDRRPEDGSLGLLSRPQTSIVDNGVFARALLRRSRLEAPAPAAAQLADVLIRSHAPELERYGIFGSEFALACLERLRTPLTVNILGPQEATGQFVAEAARIAYPTVAIRLHDPKSAAGVAQSFGVRVDRLPAAFACAGTACSRLFLPGEPFADEAVRLVRADVKAS